MASLWYVIVTVLFGAYAVLDGFDLGAGSIHRLVGRTPEQRAEILSAIGPYWDGNEVFLLAAGATLLASFGKVLTSALSGMYLAVFLILWALILRGISIEFRSHLRDGMWHAFWDNVFMISSAALSVLLGVALGNVVRGFPLDHDGWFALELFSFAAPSYARAIVDRYTLSVGVFVAVTLMAHGARFVAWKTHGDLSDRARRLGSRVQGVMVWLWLAVGAMTGMDAPAVMSGFAQKPLAGVFLISAAASLAVSRAAAKRTNDLHAFVASSGFVASMVAMVSASMFPVMLRAVGNAGGTSLTVVTGRNADASLATGLRWWFFAAVLVLGYFVNVFRLHQGKTVVTEH
jgi:cytochrome bd ubiquinol oxidase subunit II